ncbi:MAG: diguanylate cyclase, partial [Paraburkholderia sp.]
MTPFLSRRLLINLAVVAAAVGANAFVAYTQIRGQRDADVRTLRSTDIRQNLDAYRTALDDGLAALGRFEATGRSEPVDAASAMTASLAGLERTLAAELADEPMMAASLGKLSSESRGLQGEIKAALVRARASGPDESRAWAASAYTQLGMELDRVEAALATLRQQENHALQASLAESNRQTQRAMLVLIITM